MNAAVSSPRIAHGWPELSGGYWLAKRLGLRGVLVNTKVLAGVTDAPERRRRLKELLREAITERRCHATRCGSHSGADITYAEAFERLFGEAL